MLPQQWPKVSVVIPTVARAELPRAIESIRKQDYAGDVEIVVVFDLDEHQVESSQRRLADGAQQVHYTGGARKGGFARNLGVTVATGDFVAFLDDDDEWKPSKLDLQVREALALMEAGRRPVIGCRTEQIVTRDGVSHVVKGIPATLIGDETIQKYLFVKRRPGARRASFATSTILVERDIATAVPWEANLPRHQDWDWLIRLGRISDVCFRQVPVDLVAYHVGSEGSISAGKDWQSSLDWARSQLLPGSRRVFVDFLMAQTMRYALLRGDAHGAVVVIREVFGARMLPNLGPLIIGMAGILPRKTFENLMRRVK